MAKMAVSNIGTDRWYRRLRRVLDYRRSRRRSCPVNCYDCPQISREPASPRYANPGFSMLFFDRNPFPVLPEHRHREPDVRNPDCHYRDPDNTKSA